MKNSQIFEITILSHPALSKVFFRTSSFERLLKFGVREQIKKLFTKKSLKFKAQNSNSSNEHLHLKGSKFIISPLCGEL